MKKIVLPLLLAFGAAAVMAADAPAAKQPAADTTVDRAIREALPVCPDAKVTQGELGQKLPLNFKGGVVKVDSERAACAGQYATITTPTGGFFLGIPWFIESEEGTTIEERLKNFTWRALQTNFQPVITRTRNQYGLFPVTLNQMTEYGKMPIEGEIDPEGKVFFFGHFHPLSGNMRDERTKAFAPFTANAPQKGADKPVLTIIEFSDFECPSCKHAAGYLEPILAKHGDKVRYVRYDLPLVSAHPWAFTAAVAGRAIYRQKPELFWEYKKQVYENQDKLSTFTIDDFVRGFAQEHELDMKKYDADVASAELRDELLRGAGVAFTNDVRATPTYIVNGAVVDAGDDGKGLQAYVDGALK